MSYNTTNNPANHPVRTQNNNSILWAWLAVIIVGAIAWGSYAYYHSGYTAQTANSSAVSATQNGTDSTTAPNTATPSAAPADTMNNGTSTSPSTTNNNPASNP